MATEPERQDDSANPKDGGKPLAPAVPLDPQGTTPPRKTTRREVISFSTTAYSGPVPLPEIIREWEDLLPGSADRLLTMAERQAEHRMSLEKTVIQGDSQRANWGLGLAFVVTLVLISGGLVLIGLGHDVAGASVIGTNAIGLAALFIYGQESRKKERKERMEAALRDPREKAIEPANTSAKQQDEPPG